MFYKPFNIYEFLENERKEDEKTFPLSLDVLKKCYLFKDIDSVEVFDNYVVIKNKWLEENDKFQIKTTTEDAKIFKKEFDEYLENNKQNLSLYPIKNKYA